VETLKNAESSVRGLALDGLAKIGAPAVPALVDALGSNWVDVRVQAARHLGQSRISDKMVVIGLAHTLKDPNAMVRRSAAQALQILGPGARLAAPALLAALRDPDDAVRHQVFLALTTVRGDAKEMVPALVKLLKDDKAQIRQNALAILSGYGAPALPHIVAALKDVDPSVRQQAVFGLQAIPGDIKEALPALVPMLKDANVNTRRITILLLGRVGDEAVPHLREALKDPAPNLRWTAANSLSNLGPAAKKAVPELVELAAGDTNITVRRMSMNAVFRIQPDDVGPLFDKIKKNPDFKSRLSAYQALAFNKQVSAKVAVPILVEGLKDSAARVRQICVLSLGRHGPAAKSAVEPLTAALNDADPQVRTLAQSALRQIQGK
jgi:HEAT repeat protein